MSDIRFMKFFLGLLLSVSSTVHALDMTSPLMQDDQTQVQVSDMEALLVEGHAKAQLQTLEQRQKVDQLIQQIYLTKKVADAAKKGAIGGDPLIQARLQRMIERFYFVEKLKELDNEPLPDFSQAIDEEYAANPGKYTIPEKVDVSHVLIRTKERYTQVRSPEEAKKLANEVRQKALDGVPFEDLVKEFSEDPSKHKNKGSLGLLEKGNLVKSFEEAAFGLKNEGDISEVVESDFGYHVIKLLRRVPARERKFDEVRKEIEAKMVKDYISTRRQTYFDKILEANKPKIYDDQVDAFIQDKKASLSAELKQEND
ncbi:MAG: hypothetical protein C0631_09415 [Sedimenticola sp.]|nr:MAG: hypothetical protein C0631_09415 [Sedimenticola sp.]